MTPDQYLYFVLRAHEPAGSFLIAESVVSVLAPHVHAWANGHVYEMLPSGSLAKGTSIIDSSDIDILVSVSHTPSETLQQIYRTLYNRLSSAGLSPREQNVSLGIEVNGLSVDVVPAKRHKHSIHDHSLWSHKTKTYRTTNINEHINLITTSGMIDEIKLLKIWRHNHRLDFPSFPLEVTVIKALEDKPDRGVSTNFLAVLTYLRDEFTTARIIDPTKPSNILSDELTPREKLSISNKAAQSLQMPYFNQMVW